MAAVWTRWSGRGDAYWPSASTSAVRRAELPPGLDAAEQHKQHGSQNNFHHINHDHSQYLALCAREGRSSATDYGVFCALGFHIFILAMGVGGPLEQWAGRRPFFWTGGSLVARVHHRIRR